MKYAMEMLLVAVVVLISSSVKASDEPMCGTTYIRWGRTSCAQDSEFVYWGYAAGSHYTQSGGGANYLCMPLNPTFRTNGPGTSRAHLYGTEYEGPPAPAVQDREALCAVCKAPRCAVFMLPGRDECYNGWITEYSGWLATDHSSHKRSEYVCIDDNADLGGSTTNHNGALFYPVQTVCGALPCGYYPNGRDTRCAVCSQ